MFQLRISRRNQQPMATLKLKKSAKDTSAQADRAPVRGVGAGVRKKRPTLAEAQAQRAEREARYQEQVRHRYGDNPPARFKQAGDGPPDVHGHGRGPATPRRQDGRGAAPGHEGRGDGRARDPHRADDRQPPRQRPRAPDAGPRQDDRARPGASRRDDRNDRNDRPDRNNAFGHAPRPDRNTAFGSARPAPARGDARDGFPARRDPRDRGDAWPARRADPRDDAPRHGRRDDRPQPQASARPDPGLRREDQRRRGPGRPDASPDPRARARPRPARRDDDEDDGPFHAEQPGSMRLSKRMSELGMSSRREADEWIPKGWVRVDGRVVTELGSRVLPGQHITIDAKARNQQAMRVTVLINKPVGYVSGQAEDGYEPAYVLVTPENQWREDRSSIRFLPAHLRNLAPAGRLDIDSVGLLVLTQDGRIAKQLVGEDSEVEKEYLVRVQSKDGNRLSERGLQLLRHGLELDGQPLRPAQVEWVNEDQLRFVLREGRKRQIRRMCEAVGLDVLGLKRVRIGRVMLGDLPPGQWRYLRGDESFLDPAPVPASD